MFFHSYVSLPEGTSISDKYKRQGSANNDTWVYPPPPFKKTYGKYVVTCLIGGPNIGLPKLPLKYASSLVRFGATLPIHPSPRVRLGPG